MRLVPLDILRLIAVVLVLGRHMTPCPSEASPLLHAFTTIWHRGGWIGVDLFFVLSGFLVSGLLFREHQKTGDVRLTRFLIRRGLKIYPMFWGLMVATVAYTILQGKYLFPDRLAAELLFVQNYTRGLWNHTWSLAVEEHFYLALAAIVAIMLSFARQRDPFSRQRSTGENPFQAIPLVFALIASVCFLARLGSYVLIENFTYQTHFFATHLRIDSLMFGVLLAYLWHMHGWLRMNKLNATLLIAVGIALCSPAFILELGPGLFIPVFGVALFSLGSGAILIGAMNYDYKWSAPWRWIATLGASSYAIYLWHMPILEWLTPLVADRFTQDALTHWLVYAGFYLAASLLLGHAISRLLEMPTLALRDRLFPASATKQPPASPQLPAATSR